MQIMWVHQRFKKIEIAVEEKRMKTFLRHHIRNNPTATVITRAGRQPYTWLRVYIQMGLFLD